MPVAVTILKTPSEKETIRPQRASMSNVPCRPPVRPMRRNTPPNNTIVICNRPRLPATDRRLAVASRRYSSSASASRSRLSGPFRNASAAFQLYPSSSPAAARSRRLVSVNPRLRESRPNRARAASAVGSPSWSMACSKRSSSAKARSRGLSLAARDASARRLCRTGRSSCSLTSEG